MSTMSQNNQQPTKTIGKTHTRERRYLTILPQIRNKSQCNFCKTISCLSLGAKKEKNSRSTKAKTASKKYPNFFKKISCPSLGTKKERNSRSTKAKTASKKYPKRTFPKQNNPLEAILAKEPRTRCSSQ